MSISRAPTRAPELVEMWRGVYRNSRQTFPALPIHTPVILFHFSGGGLSLVTGHPIMTIATFPCRILGCWMFAGDDNLQPVAVTATVDLRIGQRGSWSAGSSPLYGSTMPGLTAASEADVSVADWLVNLQPGDLLPARLATFSGLATWLLLALPLRKLDAIGLGADDLVDSAEDQVVDESGNQVVLRG